MHRKKFYKTIRYPFPPYHSLPLNRTYSTVNPANFITSAQTTKLLLDDAHVLLNKLTASKQFSFDLMNAAQQSKKEAVNQMIQSLPLKNQIHTTYNPDAVTFSIQDKKTAGTCCRITLQLKWS